MNDCECISKCFKTILEMLQDRHYQISDDLKNLNDNDYRYMYNNNKYNFNVINDNKKCHIMFFLNTTSNPLKINTIRDSINKIDSNDNDEFLIILRHLNNSLKKIEKEYNCNMFWYKDLLINITKHKYVPKHELVKKEEEKDILKQFKLSSKLQLMYILLTDPICKYYNYKQGGIVKITRNSKTSGNNIVYRYIK